MPEVRWYLQKYGSASAPTVIVRVTFWPGPMSWSIPCADKEKLCSAAPVLVITRVNVPGGTSVRQVGSKKKSPAAMRSVGAHAARPPWSAALAARAAAQRPLLAAEAGRDALVGLGEGGRAPWDGPPEPPPQAVAKSPEAARSTRNRSRTQPTFT